MLQYLPERLLSGVFTLFLFSAGASAQQLTSSREEQVNELFSSTVQPAIEAHCVSCHGRGQTFSDLDLRTREGILRGGKRGSGIVPGNASKSLLLAAIEGQGALKMPPGERQKLPPETVDAIRRWIDAGAPWPDNPARSRPVWNYLPEDVWAWQPVRRYPIPKKGPSPVDAFILQKLEEKGLPAAPEADLVTLIRRATFDLIGLPPTPEEVDSFVQDPSPDAYRNLVERLLASPRYGERFGRHWLDVVRYADTDGYSNDYERPNAWRYRDYVIRSFNQDKPYDRFVLEQLAGDELDPGNPENLLATGFLRMGPWEHTGMSVAAITRQMFLDDVTHNTATAFLDLTVGCARCHDHKFDPIPTRDYYRLQAVFASTEFEQRPAPFLPTENQSGFAKQEAAVRDSIRDATDKLDELDEKVRQGLVRKHGLKSAEELPPEVLREGLKKKESVAAPDLERERIYRKRTELYGRALDRYRPLAYSVSSGGLKEKKAAAETFILAGGNLRSPGEKVEPDILSAVYRFNDELDTSVPNQAEGRRAALDRWIAAPANPLTARVMVNRIWQYHFGQGLVATSNNFGKMGRRPSHPELLDWLAAYFVEHGWSVKQMHRLIMFSQVYRRSSEPAAAAKISKTDPGNQLLSFFPPHRMEAEVLRDSILAVAGELSLQTGGPGSFPEINYDLATQSRLIMGTLAPAYQPSPTRRERNRRTIYTFQKRSIMDPVVEVFNGPNQNDSCERRESTTVPTQVFALFNSKFARDMALAFAVRLEKIAAGQSARIDWAFRFAFNRLPTGAERKLALEHLDRATEEHRRAVTPAVPERKLLVRSLIGEYTGKRFDFEEETRPADYEENLQPAQVSPETRALADLALVLLNSNEFIYIY